MQPASPKFAGRNQGQIRSIIGTRALLLFILGVA
jgi:hypothetical protein